MEKLNSRKVKKALGISLNVLIWMIVAISLFITILVFSAQGSADGIPSLFGKSLVTIESDSMKPTFKSGDLVFMTKLSDEKKAELLPGTIITYHAPIDINGDGVVGDINTHRIVSVDTVAKTVKTQGDNKETNPVADNYTVDFKDIIGTCGENDRLGGIGAIIGFLRTSLGFFLCILLPLILFFIFELYNFISILVIERAKKAAAAAPVIDEEEIKRRAVEEYLAKQAAAAEATSVVAEAPSEEAAPVEEASAEETAAEETNEENNTDKE